MFCPVCGNQVEDDAKFCPFCGSGIAGEPTPTVSEPTPVVTNPNTQDTKKSFNFVPYILGLAALVIVVIGGFFIFGNSSGADTAVVYVKKDKLYYKENPASKKEAYEVVDLDSESEYPDYNVFFSNDGKYLYFFMESEGSYGTLSYIQVKDIKADADKNEDKIQEIESKVYMWNAQPVGENGVLYYTSNERLEYYNGKDSVRISKECLDFAFDTDKNVVIYAESDGDDRDIYGVKLSGDVEPKKIDDKVDSIYSMQNSDFILYTKNDGKTLYEAGIERDAEKITDEFYNLAAVDAEQKKIIYTNNVEKKISLYDFVDDDCLASDEGIKKPDYKDFATEVGLDVVMDSYDYEYYSLYPEELEEFYDYLWMDYTFELYYYYNSDTGTYYHYDGAKWYFIDTALYERAMEEYESIGYRVELREVLKEHEVTDVTQSVYYYESGKEAECLLEKVTDAVAGDVETKFLTYNRETVKKIKMSEISSAYDVYDFLEDAYELTAYYQINGAEEVELEEENIYSTLVSKDKSKVAIVTLEDEEYKLLVSDIKNNTLSKAETVTTETSNPMFAWKENTLYYLEDVKDGSGDLCIYKNGKSEKLIKNIGVSQVIIDGNDNCLAFEYDNDGYYDVELYNAKHERVEKFSNFRLVRYIDSKNIIFLKKEKLCLYDGSDEVKEIDKNVDFARVYVTPEEVTEVIGLSSYSNGL